MFWRWYDIFLLLPFGALAASRSLQRSASNSVKLLNHGASTAANQSGVCCESNWRKLWYLSVNHPGVRFKCGEWTHAGCFPKWERRPMDINNVNEVKRRQPAGTTDCISCYPKFNLISLLFWANIESIQSTRFPLRMSKTFVGEIYLLRWDWAISNLCRWRNFTISRRCRRPPVEQKLSSQLMEHFSLGAWKPRCRKTDALRKLMLRRHVEKSN